MLRDIENQSMILAQKSEVEEMCKGVGLMIAMAVVAALVAAGAAVIGGWRHVKTARWLACKRPLKMAGRHARSSGSMNFNSVLAIPKPLAVCSSRSGKQPIPLYNLTRRLFRQRRKNTE